MRSLFISAVFALLSLAPSASAYPFSFSFSNLDLSQLVFDGTDQGGAIGTFSFVRPAAGTFGNEFGNDFRITSNTGGWPSGDNVVSDLRGLQGRITGTFGILAPISGPSGNQTASVTNLSGAGNKFELYNVSGATNTLVMTANIQWSSIGTTGTGATLNDLGSFNLSNFTCVGSCSGNLAFLASSTNGVATVGFSTGSQEFVDLNTLTTTGRTFDSFQGVATVPEPGFYGILTIGLGGLSWFAARRRRQAETV